jgi:hypothetical protein
VRQERRRLEAKLIVNNGRERGRHGTSPHRFNTAGNGWACRQAQRLCKSGVPTIPNDLPDVCSTASGGRKNVGISGQGTAPIPKGF